MLHSKNRLGGKTATLGVIVDGLNDPYHATVCNGIEQGAAHAGVNLLFFVGGSLPASAPVAAPRHQVFELAGRHNVDGLIVFASTLSHEVGLAGVRSFCLQFAGLPLCSVGIPMPEVPSVTVDNESGMAQVVRHLVEQHAAKRIAFISGPAANAESEIRFGAYRAVLAQHGLAVEEQLRFTSNFTMEGGALAVRTLAKRLGPRLEQLEAIVAANDNMAIGAMEALVSLGISVPDRIAVVGFDDIEEARFTEPSLTTSRQPLVRIGLEAVRRLLQSRSEGDELELRIGTELVVRNSCGCSALALASRSGVVSKQRFQLALMGQRERILAQLGRAARGRFSAAGAGWEQAVFGALVEDLIAGVPQRFLPAAERLTQKLGAARIDLNAIDEVLSALREEVVPLLQNEPDKHRLAEDLFHAVRLSTSAALQRSLGRTHLQLTRWARRISVMCNAISVSVDYAELRARTHEFLPYLGLRSYFVSVYDTPGDSSEARLLVSSDAGSAEPPRAGKAFRGRELVPPDLGPAEGAGRSFSVLPLLDRRAMIGHVLFEYTAQNAFTCGAIADALSIAIRNFPRS